MNAIQPSRTQLQSVEARQIPQKKSQRHHHSNPHRVMAIETTTKLVVNVLLSAVAVAGTAQLLHHQWFQQERLQEIQAEVNLTQERVGRLQTDFNRYFDPQQTQNVMQEQSNRVATNQRRIILLKKTE